MTFALGQAVVYRKLTSSTPCRAEIVRAEAHGDHAGFVIVLDGFQRWAYADQLSELPSRAVPIAAPAEPVSVPVTEMTDQGEQIVLPGAERSAVQAAASRPERIRAKRAQAAPGGMFALEPSQPMLF